MCAQRGPPRSEARSPALWSRPRLWAPRPARRADKGTSRSISHLGPRDTLGEPPVSLRRRRPPAPAAPERAEESARAAGVLDAAHATSPPAAPSRLAPCGAVWTRSSTQIAQLSEVCGAQWWHRRPAKAVSDAVPRARLDRGPRCALSVGATSARTHGSYVWVVRCASAARPPRAAGRRRQWRRRSRMAQRGAHQSHLFRWCRARRRQAEGHRRCVRGLRSKGGCGQRRSVTGTAPYQEGF